MRLRAPIVSNLVYSGGYRDGRLVLTCYLHADDSVRFSYDAEPSYVPLFMVHQRISYLIVELIDRKRTVLVQVVLVG